MNIGRQDVQPAQRFYQYWPLSGDARRSWLERLLRDHEIYFRAREQLNDPNELRPRAILQGPPELERAYVKRVQATYGAPLPPAQRHLEEQRLLWRMRKGLVPIEPELHSLLDRIGILSLSASPNVPLLWGHYGDGYRGACVEYDASVGLFLGAQPVHYTDDAPIINRLLDDNDAILRKSMFTKSLAWSCEKEWRVIARFRDEDRARRHIEQRRPPADLADFLRQAHGPGYYSLLPHAVTGIIAGPRMDVSTLEWLRSLRDEAAPHVPIRATRTRPDGGVDILEAA